MIKNLKNTVRYALLVQVLLIGMSILLSTNSSYASTNKKRGRYYVKFEISFSDTTSKAKIIKRMCRHYGLHISYNYNFSYKNYSTGLMDWFPVIKRICWYTYSARLKITDMFNPDFKISEFKIKKKRKSRIVQYDDEVL